MKSHYPDFDVLDEQYEWDEHTRDIVLKRVGKRTKMVFFTQGEELALKALSASILDDDREEILDFVVSWYDEKLCSAIGEGEREENIPPEGELVKSGLKALDIAASILYDKGASELVPEVRAHLLQELQLGTISADMKWASKLQQALFKKVALSIVKAYYSHPAIWSEIGYAGPAYPRGYVRTEFGLTDPWEAKRSGK